MPSMVSTERTRLRRRDSTDWLKASTISMALVRAEAFHWSEGCGAQGGVHAGADGDGSERKQRRDDGESRDGGNRNERRQRDETYTGDDGEGAEEAEAAADEHDVHDADAAEREGEQSDSGEEDRHDLEDAVSELDAVERVPDPERVEVDGVKVVARAEDLANLAHRGLMQLRVHRLDDDVVDEAWKGTFEVGWEVAHHGGVGDEHLRVVGAGAVATVLLFLLEHADDN